MFEIDVKTDNCKSQDQKPTKQNSKVTLEPDIKKN